jgi:hypothetical protein
MTEESAIEKYGIEETRKAIVAVKEGFVGLRKVEWEKIGKEISDLKPDEFKEVLAELAKMAFKLMSYAQEGKAVLRMIRFLMKI